MNINLLFAIAFFTPSICFSEGQETIIEIGIYSEHISEVEEVMDGGVCPSPSAFPIANNQVLGEFLLLCEVLKLGGITPKFELKSFPGYSRMVRELSEGDILALGFGIWYRDIDGTKAHISSPIIPRKTFTKGFYAKKPEVLNIVKTWDAFLPLTVVTNNSWGPDVDALRCVGSKMLNARTYVNMFRMVGVARSDYLITTFPPGDNLDIEFYGVKLRPIEGIKIIFDDSLHYVISRRHPDGEKIYMALERGLKIARENGTLEYVISQYGHFNSVTKDWKNMGCVYQ